MMQTLSSRLSELRDPLEDCNHTSLVMSLEALIVQTWTFWLSDVRNQEKYLKAKIMWMWRLLSSELGDTDGDHVWGKLEV